MLLVLERGEPGSAYNIADRGYQMTVREFAERTAETVGCKVVFKLSSGMEKKEYFKISRQVLNAEKLEKLGWTPVSAHAMSETIVTLKSYSR
ncbi:hypothetical protein D5270_14145 [Acutalibacter sp. 1XD8-36]|nr:hypothetical protein [Acutalibacter sp. 1XD8-36]